MHAPDEHTVLAASGGRLAQRLHASLIVILPALALIAAAWALGAQAVQAWHLAIAAGMAFLTILAITVGFHRLLTHRAFQTGPVLRALLTIAGCMAAQGPPLYWVGNHRRHHRFVDRDGDPHSPWNDKGRALPGWGGFWHAHVGWTLRHELVNSIDYCPDLLRDPVVRWAGRHYFKWVVLGILLPGAAGWAIAGTLSGFAAGCFWGGPVRLLFTYHLTNGINSAAHIWGYQRYDTGDSSRNNWFLGIFTLGEGWHNNHHADGTAAVFSRAWYEIDIGGAFILLLARCGLARNVRRARDERKDASGPGTVTQTGAQPCADSAAASRQGVSMSKTTCPHPAEPHARRPKQRPTVNNRIIRRAQHVHTVLATAAGLSGVLAAAALHIWVRPVSPAALGIFLLCFLLVGMGLTIGYHRLFTHRSYRAPAGLRLALAILGSMAAQGPVVFWAALHRMHHQLADKEGDPHSPNLHGSVWHQKLRGLWHAYIGWTVRHEVPNANFYARDLLAEPRIMWVNKHYYLWIAAGLALPAALVGALGGTAYAALEGFLWGGLIRMFALHNVIWWITSFAHVFGSRDYASRDLSTNNAWLAIPTLGESWHNHHHAFPRAAILSFAWWQIDISGMVIAALEKLGVVSEVCRVSAEERQRRRVG